MDAATVEALIETFLDGRRIAVAGASAKPAKWGYKVFRALTDAGYEAIPVHPAIEALDGVKAYAKLADVPGPIDGVSVITPPGVSEAIVREAAGLGIPLVWLQPGAESKAVLEAGEACGQRVIHDACVLVALRLRARGR